MITVLKYLILAAITAAVSGCSNNEQEPTGVIPHAQKQAVEKARGVEDALQQQAEQTRRQVDEAE